MLLSLSHAEEMTTILGADIEDQRERQEYLDLPTNSKGESLNQIRFNTASHLASVTLIMLYIGTAVASIYLLSCLGLLIGTVKNRSELLLPWLVLDLIGALLVVSVAIVGSNDQIFQYTGGKIQFCKFKKKLRTIDSY